MVLSCIENRMEQAKQAKKYWLQNSLDEYDCVLLLPHIGEHLNTLMLSGLAEKLRIMAAEDGSANWKAIVLSVEPPNDGECFTCRQIPEEMAQSIITAYCMYEFTDKLVIGSFDLPYGRKLKNLLDCGIASKAELVRTAIFHR